MFNLPLQTIQAFCNDTTNKSQIKTNAIKNPSHTYQDKYTKNQKNSQIFKLNKFKHSNINTIIDKV